MLEKPGDPGHRGQIKVFSVQPLCSSSGGSDHLELRLNWLARRAPDGRLRACLGRPVQLGHAQLTAVDLETEHVSYGELTETGPVWDCLFTFLSPTYFSRSGRDYLLPDPELVVLRLAARWNEHVCDQDFAITDESVRGLARRVILMSHRIHTVRVNVGRDRVRAGFVGQARLGLRAVERRQPEGIAGARLFGALCGFAPFCGVGAQTTHGFGAVSTSDHG